MRKKLFLLLVCSMTAVCGVAQGIIFEEGFENGTDGWTIVNGSQTNKWCRGTATKSSGNYSMYISNDDGISNNYTSGYSTNIVHFYKDITFPVSSLPYWLTFQWKGKGDYYMSNPLASPQIYVYLQVYITETTITPVAGSAVLSYKLSSEELLYYDTWQKKELLIPASYSGTTKRLVFSWISSFTTGGSKTLATAVDDISLVCSVAKEGLVYKLNSAKTATVYGLNDTSIVDLNIPDNIIHEGENYMVTSIAANAFSECSGLTSITIPNSVTNVGAEAFRSCTGLTSVTIPESITSIGVDAFLGCTNLTILNFNATDCKVGFYGAWKGCSKLSVINIGSEVKTIPAYTFAECSGLTSITIPNSVTSIGGYAFSGCANLSTLNFNAINCSQMDNANGNVFYGCSKLRIVNIGNDVKTIPVYAFYNCNLFSSVTFGNSVTSIGDYAFYGCSGLTSITIPESMKNIGNGVFSSCSGLTSIIIPNSVTSVGAEAFSDCTGLTSIIMPNNITSIGDETFQNCIKLLSINIPNNVKTIGSNAFYGCSKFTSITIPSSVISIGNTAFARCNNLMAINVEANNTAYISENGILFNKDETTLIQYPPKKTGTTYIIPNTVTTLASEAFCNCTTLTSIIIPNSVIRVGANAFYNCKPSEVSVPDMLNVYASLLTPSLRKLTLTNSVAIGASTFNAVTTNLAELNLPNTLTSIANGSLARLENLTSLTLPFIGASPTTPTSLGTLFSGNVPATLKKLTLVRSSNDITIADNALSGLSNLKEVTFSSNIRGLGRNALDGCSGLDHIYAQRANPPSAYALSTFEGVGKYDCMLHIPEGSSEKYKTATGWSEFFYRTEDANVSITALAVPLHGGLINGVKQYNYEQTATLEAAPHANYTFKGWMENNQIVSTNKEYTFTVTGPRTLYAIFTPRENADENIQIQAQANSASISWIAVEDAANYTLIIYSDESRTQEIARFQLDVNGNIVRSATRNLSCTIPNLNLATTYYYSLTSYDKNKQALTISNGNFATTNGAGIDNLVVNNRISIYPNPVSESFSFSGITENTLLKIVDITGKIVLQQTVNLNETVWVAHLQKGVYFVNVKGQTVKMIKK